MKTNEIFQRFRASFELLANIQKMGPRRSYEFGAAWRMFPEGSDFPFLTGRDCEPEGDNEAN